jgi:hypothetical protein
MLILSHSDFCGYILGVKKTTNTVAIYGELGRIVFRKLRILNYWVSILNDTTSLKYKLYTMLRSDADSGNSYREKFSFV